MKLKKLYLPLIITGAAFAFACSGGSKNANNANANNTDVNANVNTNVAPAHTQVPIPTPEIPTKNPDFKMEMSSAQAGNETELTFTIKDKNGNQVKDFQVVHEMKMHLIVVSDDLAEFEHLHPDLQADGSFKIKYGFKHGGKFLLYPDATPVGGTQVVQRFEININGNPKVPEQLITDLNLQKTVDGLTVTMKPESELKANNEMTINFMVTDETGSPVRDLQNYLGELAHIVIISQDTQDFLHVHPMSNKKPEETSVMAHTTFPRKGIYKIWAQFQRNNKVIAVPFVVDIVEGAQPTATAVKPENGVVKMQVNGDGFKPAAIELKKGEPVKLLITRTDEKNCASEIVFPSLNIRRELPVGQEVAIDLNPTETGEINFACGMNMYKGTILVQ